MTDRARRSSGQDLEASSPDRIRNVVLIGPGGSGKTTLVETLLASSGAIGRAGSVRDGTTVCDFEDAEHAHERSISLAVAPLVRDGVKVNLIDTPGYADFVGELRAGLRAADCALFVIAANEGIDATTRTLWRECAEVAMPRAVVVTKLDQARADYDGVLLAAQDAFGDKVLPLYLPVRTGDEVTALAGLLSPSEHADDEQRGTFIEAVIEESEDETLMDRYLEGEEIAEDVLVADLEKAVARASFHPVVPVCSVTGVGCTELLDLMVRAFPSPLEHTPPEVFTPAGAVAPAITCDPDGPLVAEVVRTTSDPYVGRLSVVRVFSGTLVPDATVHVSGHFSSFFGAEAGHADHDEDEKIGALAHAFGRHLAPAARVVAGDICSIGRLTRAETGDTLSSVDDPRVLRPWSMPEPLLPVAIVARSKADDDKLASALSRLAAEDPSIRIENNAETHQLVLWCMGETHAAVVLERLDERYSVHVDQAPYLVSLRETFGGPAKGHGRHVKQSGGHGQYAVCDIEVEPLPEGGGFEFVDKVVGGAVPAQLHPVGGEGRPEPDGARGAGRLPGRRPAGHAHRRQGPRRGLLRHGLPDGRRAGAARGRDLVVGHPAGALRRGDGGDPRRPGRRGDVGPVGPPRPAARHRQGRRRPHPGARRGPPDRAHPLRHRPALVHPRLGDLHPRLRALRADARGRRPRGRRARLARLSLLGALPSRVRNGHQPQTNQPRSCGS